MNLLKFFFYFNLIQISISALCIEDNFMDLKLFSPNNFQIAAKKEICYKYKLNMSKDKISLFFIKLNSSPKAEVIIYKNKSDIILKEDYYENFYERYIISENIFKEIDVSNFEDYIYIIIRDPKNFDLQSNSVILYDSKLPIPLLNGQPQTIKYFMSNNIYIFTYNSNKNLTLVYSVKEKSKKYITVKYYNKTYVEKKIDTTDEQFNFESKDSNPKILILAVEDIQPSVEEEEFTVIVYEKGVEEFKEIKKNEIININYINLNKNDEKQKFYFYYNLNSETKSNTINFDLDPIAKKNEYINISSGIYHSGKELSKEDFGKFNFENKNYFPIEYDINSDKYKRIYFQDKELSYPYRYIYFKIEISKLDNYFSPKFLLISIGEEVQEIDLKNIDYYNTEVIKQNVSLEFPSYFKLLLDPKERYIFISAFPNNSLYVEGDLLIKDELNKKYKLNNEYFEDIDEIFTLSNISEFTVRILGEDIFSTTFYVEKYDPMDLMVNEYSRNDEPIEIRMEEDYCKGNKKKYFLGIYDKELYKKENKKIAKYWTSEEDTMNVYYRGDINLEGKSIFPTSLKYNIKEETSIILTSYMDFFTFSCIKPGSIFIRSIYKSFEEITHIIMFNTINTITISNNIEIIQLSSPIKYVSDYLYFAIRSNNGKKITIFPDTSELFNETVIYGNNIFTFKFNLKKYKSDQLALKVNSSELTDIEVISVIRYNSSKYIIISNSDNNYLTNNNFVKFIDKNTKKIKMNIKGLNNILIVYGLLKLITDNVEYLPFAYQLKENVIRKNITSDETIEIDNEFYGKNDDNKNYIGLVFSIPNYLYYKYYVQIEEIKDDTFLGINKNILFIILIIIGGVLIISLIICITCIITKKKKKDVKKYEMDVENLNKEPLSAEGADEDEP